MGGVLLSPLKVPIPTTLEQRCPPKMAQTKSDHTFCFATQKWLKSETGLESRRLALDATFGPRRSKNQKVAGPL